MSATPRGGGPPARLLRSPVERVQTFDGVKYTARDGSWLAFRGSGTEPVLRIYAEADSDVKAARLLKAGRGLIGQNERNGNGGA